MGERRFFPLKLLPSMPNHKKKIVIVAGPTASGKTSLAIRLATLFHGEIVSADSIQIYRSMDIGSAKPAEAEKARIYHHMIDIRDPDEDYSVGDYVREARSVIERIIKKGTLPFVVGGTGLYIRGLLGGLVDLPPSDPDLRAELFRQLQESGPSALYERLNRLDSESALRIGAHNASRIVRALEILELTGRRMSELIDEHVFRERPYDALFVCIAPTREVLYERIDNRVENMINTGLLQEVTNLRSMGYGSELKSMQSLGYRHAAMILDGKADAEEAVRLMKRDTRHYAKRQLTWFRSESDAKWFDPFNISAIEVFVENFLGQDCPGRDFLPVMPTDPIKRF